MSARAVVRALARRGLTVAVAESFTGGGLMDAITDVPGASKVFRGGVVAYADEAKAGLLGVPRRILSSRGAVSLETADAMARGVRRRFRADIGVATTGIAGPSGARPGKPVGLSIVAVAGARRSIRSQRVHPGARSRVKSAARTQALRLLVEFLRNSQSTRPKK